MAPRSAPPTSAPKKTLYHSELVKMGAVNVTVTSEVSPSQFPGKADWVGLTIGGHDRQYSAENPSCADFFRGQNGRSFLIQADGTRDSATITYLGESGADAGEQEEAAPEPKPQPRKAAAPKKKTSTPPPAAAAPAPAPAPTTTRPPNMPPPETPEGQFKKAQAHACRVANVWLIALQAGIYARQQAEEQFGEKITPEQFQAMVSTITVQMEKDGFHRQIAAKILPFKKPATVPASEPAPEPTPGK